MVHDIYQIIFLLIISLTLLLLVWRLRLKRIKTYRSPLLGKIEIFEKYNRELSLTINNYVQGVSINSPSIEKSYWGYIANEVVGHCQNEAELLSFGNKKKPKVLMLGLGANTISHLIAQKNSSINQTVLEIDESIIKACQDFFDLNKTPNVKIIRTDAIRYFTTPPTLKYDCIIVDIFTGKTPYVVEESNKPKFIKKLVKNLENDGLVLFNRPGTQKRIIDDNQNLEKFLKTIFKQTGIHLVCDPRGYKNNIITGKIQRR